ncbi:MAG: substrate-binding periplasmic protein [Bacillota bacterium]
MKTIRRGCGAGGARRWLAAAALLACIAGARAQSLDELTFITEDYPPFNFERRGQRQGISVDLLEEMLVADGAAKRRKDIKVWPWARAYQTALRERNTVLFSTARTGERESLFKWVGPIMPSRIVLVARKTSRIRFGSLDELNRMNLRIGVVREDIGGLLLARQGVQKEKMLQAHSGKNLAKMLQAGRVDLWAYGAQVIQWNLKEMGYPSADYEEVHTLADDQHYYFALNKDTDDRLVARLQAALDALRASGRLAEIVARY